MFSPFENKNRKIDSKLDLLLSVSEQAIQLEFHLI